jgi:hypothetical protein
MTEIESERQGDVKANESTVVYIVHTHTDTYNILYIYIYIQRTSASQELSYYEDLSQKWVLVIAAVE